MKKSNAILVVLGALVSLAALTPRKRRARKAR